MAVTPCPYTTPPSPCNTYGDATIHFRRGKQTNTTKNRAYTSRRPFPPTPTPTATIAPQVVPGARGDADVDGIFTWYDLVMPLESATKMAVDFNLLDARKVTSDTIASGCRMVAACGNPRIVLGVFFKMLPFVQGFSKMLPFVQGVSQEVDEADCADPRKVHAMRKNRFTSPDGTGFAGPALTGFGSQAGTGFGGRVAPVGAAARRKQAQAVNAGTKNGNAFPMARTHANGGQGAYQGRGAAAPAEAGGGVGVARGAVTGAGERRRSRLPKSRSSARSGRHNTTRCQRKKGTRWVTPRGGET